VDVPSLPKKANAKKPTMAPPTIPLRKTSKPKGQPPSKGRKPADRALPELPSSEEDEDEDLEGNNPSTSSGKPTLKSVPLALRRPVKANWEWSRVEAMTTNPFLDTSDALAIMRYGWKLKCVRDPGLKITDFCPVCEDVVCCSILSFNCSFLTYSQTLRVFSQARGQLKRVAKELVVEHYKFDESTTLFSHPRDLKPNRAIYEAVMRNDGYLFRVSLEPLHIPIANHLQ